MTMSLSFQLTYYKHGDLSSLGPQCKHQLQLPSLKVKICSKMHVASCINDPCDIPRLRGVFAAGQVNRSDRGMSGDVEFYTWIFFIDFLLTKAQTPLVQFFMDLLQIE